MSRSVQCKFITFEGIDGSGKSTVAEVVVKELRRRGLDVVLTIEPTKTWLGDAVKRSYSEDVSPYSEAFLFLADRATHTNSIKKWIEDGKLVVSDRYCDSTYAYQAARLDDIQSNSLEWLEELSKSIIIEPNLTILLDVKPEVGLERIKPRAKKVHFENVEFLKKVRENYLKLSKKKRFTIIDASKSFEEVVKDTLSVISSKLSVS